MTYPKGEIIDQPLFTVWDCTVPTTGQRSLVVRQYQIDDYRHEHTFQRIAYRGPARDRDDALHRARTAQGA